MSGVLPSRSRIWALAAAALLSAVTFVVVPTGPASGHAPHDQISDVVVSPAYATDRTVFTISRHRLMRSTDGGSSWAEIVRGITGEEASTVAIAPSDPRTMYLGTRDEGIFRSRDRGSSWARVHSTAPADIAVSPGSPDIALATGLSGGLLRTTDGGRTWAAVGAFGAVTALQFVTAGRVVAGGGGRVFTSDDGGQTWVQSSSVTGGTITAVTSNGATVLLGTALGRLFRSTNRGASFVQVGAGLPQDRITSIAVTDTYASDGTVWVSMWHERVHRSRDRGASFSTSSIGLTTNDQALIYDTEQFGDLTVATNSDGRHVMFVAAFDGLFRSVDGAGHWQEVQTLAEYVVGLAVSPNYVNDRTVISTTYVKGAYISNDRGATWRGSHVGLGYAIGNGLTPVYRLTNVVFSPNYARDGTIFSAGAQRVLKSSNRGASWTAMTVATFPTGTLQQLFIIAVSPAFATDQTIYLGSREGVIYRSRAGGDTGTWVEVGRVSGKIRSLLVNPRFPADRGLWASTSTGVFKSVDAGQSWTRTGPAGTSLLAISPNYAVDGTVFSGTESGLFVTRDRGAHWTELSSSPLSTSSHVEAVSVSPSYATDRTVLVSVLGKGLYRSSNGGASFARTGASLDAENLLIADFDNPTSAPIQFSPAFAVDRTIFAMAQTHIVRSTDGGASWQALDLPPAAAFLGPPAIRPAPTAGRVNEARSGSDALRVAFDLSHPYASTVTVDWRTVDVPQRQDIASSAAGDYIAASGQLVFPRGTTRQQVQITVRDDQVDEVDELVVIALRAPVHATLGANLGYGIIEDDDGAP